MRLVLEAGNWVYLEAYSGLRLYLDTKAMRRM